MELYRLGKPFEPLKRKLYKVFGKSMYGNSMGWAAGEKDG